MDQLYGRYHGRILVLAARSTEDGAWKRSCGRSSPSFDDDCRELSASESQLFRHELASQLEHEVLRYSDPTRSAVLAISLKHLDDYLRQDAFDTQRMSRVFASIKAWTLSRYFYALDSTRLVQPSGLYRIHVARVSRRSGDPLVDDERWRRSGRASRFVLRPDSLPQPPNRRVLNKRSASNPFFMLCEGGGACLGSPNSKKRSTEYPYRRNYLAKSWRCTQRSPPRI